MVAWSACLIAYGDAHGPMTLTIGTDQHRDVPMFCVTEYPRDIDLLEGGTRGTIVTFASF
jgi:hypothetical protein